MFVLAMTALTMKYCEGKTVDGAVPGPVFGGALVQAAYVLAVSMNFIHDTYECPLA